MKKWSLGILLLIFGWVSAVHAEGAYQMKSGETVFGRFGPRTGTLVCKLNKELGIINDCNRIKAGQWLKVPANVGGKAVTYKNVVAKPAEPACITLGAAPFNPEHSLKRMLEGIDLLTKLTPEKKELAKRKFLLGEKATTNELVGQQIFGEMLYQSKDVKKGVVHVYDKPICSPEQGGQPEVMNTYDLGDGVFLADPRRCGNPSVLEKPVLKSQPEPEPKLGLTPEPKLEPKPGLAPEPQEMPSEEAVRRWDWELVVGQEHDRTSHSTFASGAIYGLFVDAPGAEHAFGVGGTYSGWHGKTDTGFGFNGRLSGGLCPAYKYSAYEDGYDFGLKLCPWASLTENGEQAAFYKSHRHFDLNGVTLAYNNGRREMMGEKSFFKHQLFLSAFKPIGGEAEHSMFGQPLPDANAKLDYVINIGGRVGLYDFSKEDDKIGAKLWFAAGWFKEAPSLAETANWRIQLSDKHERLFLGIGRNYDLLNGGSLFGYGWSWDIRKTVYVHREETRRAQFVAAIEKAGGRLDKDGMVILPKGMKNSQKQFKAAPSDD